MKIHGNLLALCAFHPNVWGSAAFLLQTPKALAPKGSHTADAPLLPPLSQSSDPYDQARKIADPLGREAAAPPLTEAGGDPYPNRADAISARVAPVTIQGGETVKTWSFNDPSVKRVRVVMKTTGRPMNADVDLWQGPDNNPQRMRIYVENGLKRPFSTVIECPRSNENTVRLRNTGPMEFPLSACVEADLDMDGPAGFGPPTLIQGGALKTYDFEPNVESVQVLMHTDGRPLNAMIELLLGPNNKKVVVDVYTEDGVDRPFYAVFETPGSAGYMVRVINTSPVEFPLTAWVEPYVVGQDSGFEPIVSGGGF